MINFINIINDKFQGKHFMLLIMAIVKNMVSE
jgi:hypothetical protein